MTQCWINGDFVAPEEAKISVFDHGLLYGDGVFEGLRFYQNRIFRLQDHLQRLFDSAAAICLSIPYTEQELTQALEKLVDSYGGENGYIRLVVTRGSGALGIDPRLCDKPNTIIIAEELSMVPEATLNKGARLIIASTRRLSPDGLDPRIKSLNYLNHILARIEANQAGADEAILLNNQGYVTEGSADNIFMVKNGRLLTPPVTDGALAGITRQAIIDLALAEGIPFQEHSLTPYDLYGAEECFLTGTGAELIPVREIDGRLVKNCPGGIFIQLQQGFYRLTHDNPVLLT